MKPIRFISACLLVIGLSACGNAPPLEFYTLSSVDPGTSPLTGGFQAAAIGNVNLPQVLDRQQIVRRSGENQIMIADDQRWAAPLDEMTQRVMQEDLEKILPPNALIVDPTAANNPAVAVVNVDVGTFESDLSGHVILEAHWNIVTGNPTTTITRSEAHITETAANAGYAAMADAMSHAVGDLAAQIAATLPRQ